MIRNRKNAEIRPFSNNFQKTKSFVSPERNIYICSMRKGNLIDTLTRIQDPEEMGQLLKEILTDAEWDAIDLRWQLMEKLNDGHTQREIASELGISLCKITRGSKILKTPGSVAAKYIKES